MEAMNAAVSRAGKLSNESAEGLAGTEWKELASDAARILARLLGSSELLGREEAQEAVQSLYLVNPNRFEQCLNDPEGFRDAWNRQKDLFTGSLGLVSLEESIYKAWTEDGRHPLNGIRGMASGDPCTHMHMVIQRYGMALDRREGLAADHLAVILEILAHLIENRPAGEVEAFCRDHLNWLGELLTEADGNELGGIFVLLVMTVERLIQSLIS
jgi:TorA maturation chaperone TorD